MKKILVVYDYLQIGGIATYLLELLNSIDKTANEVTLLLKDVDKKVLERIPEQVKVVRLPEISRFKKYFFFVFCGGAISAIRLFFQKKFGSKKKQVSGSCVQTLQLIGAKHSRSHNVPYDVAIGADLYWPNYYTIYKVSAARKYIWIHPQYCALGNNRRKDEKVFRRAEKIFAVSEHNAEILKKFFPSLSHQIDYFENILDPDTIINRSLTEGVPSFESDKFNIVTVCRLDNSSKRLDRCITCAKILCKSGLDFVWRIIGDGGDRNYIEKLISDARLEERVILMGARENPFPYVRASDAFVLLSQYEGVPLVVTEAMILGVPVVVSAYESASSQVPIECGKIVPNEDGEGPQQAADFLTELASNPKQISYHHTNERSIEKLKNILEGADG